MRLEWRRVEGREGNGYESIMMVERPWNHCKRRCNTRRELRRSVNILYVKLL